MRTASNSGVLGGSAVHTASESYVAGNGYLVRNRDSSSLFKLLVVSDAYDASGLATATLDVERVP